MHGPISTSEVVSLLFGIGAAQRAEAQAASIQRTADRRPELLAALNRCAERRQELLCLVEDCEEHSSA